MTRTPSEMAMATINEPEDFWNVVPPSVADLEAEAEAERVAARYREERRKDEEREALIERITNDLDFNATETHRLLERWKNDHSLAAYKGLERACISQGAEAYMSVRLFVDYAGEVNGHLKLTVNKVEVDRYIEVKEDIRSVYRWKHERTGKHSLMIGDFGNKTRYPERKDGSHNYAEAATALIRLATRDAAKEMANQIIKANEPFAKAAREELGADDWGSGWTIVASATEDKPLFVKMTISKSMTIEEARKLHIALASCGLIGRKRS